MKCADTSLFVADTGMKCADTSPFIADTGMKCADTGILVQDKIRLFPFLHTNPKKSFA